MLVVAAVALLLWLLQLALAIRVVRAIPTTASLPPAERESWPRLSMVVPARDEAEGIEEALKSKLGCAYPALEIVAVDDRSTDGTSAIVDRLAAADPRIVAAHVTTLPEGWLGKLNAMATGLKAATGEWVLFSDADVHIEPGTLKRLIAHAEQNRIDFISVFPRMNPVNAVLDAGVTVFLRVMALMGRAWAANDDRSSVGVGVGAFNLARRSVLEKTNALSHLRMEVADDVALGALFKQSGARTRFYAGRDEVHLTFLPTFAAMLKSTQKGGHMFGFSLLVPMAMGALPPVVEWGLIAAALTSGGTAAAVATLAAAVSVATHALLAWHFKAPLKGAVLWPVGQLLTALMVIYAGYLAWRRQGIYWRGTFYSRPVLEAGQVLKLGKLRIDLPGDRA